MAVLSKYHTLYLVVLLIVYSILFVIPTDAQSITKPSVPEFKLNYTNYVYDEPAATSQWSGEPIPNSGYHYDYRLVYIKVRNTPNDAYVNDDSTINGVREHLYYNVRVKNHFSNEWVEFWGQSPMYASNGSIITGTWYWGASDSEVTTIGSIALNGRTNLIHASRDVAVGDQVDFQVKALIGYQNIEDHTFIGEESAWSSTQTLTIDMSVQTTSSPPSDSSDATTEPTQSTTPSNTLDDQTYGVTSVPLSVFIAVIVALIAVIFTLLIFYRRPKQKMVNQVYSKSL
jgi:hypothetical protein